MRQGEITASLLNSFWSIEVGFHVSLDLAWAAVTVLILARFANCAGNPFRGDPNRKER